MNAVRVHRRWLIERLALLVPAFLAGLAVVLGLGIRTDLRPSFKFFSLSVSFLLNSVLGYFLVQTAVCGRLQFLGRYRQARIVRRSLGHLRSVGAASLLLLAVLGATPLLFRERASAPLQALRPRPDWKAFPAPGEPARVQTATAVLVSLEEAAASPPVLLDILGPLPHGLVDDLITDDVLDWDPFLPLRLPAHLAGTDDEENRSYQFDFAGFHLTFTLPQFLSVDRPYLPDERVPEQSYPGSVRLDAAYFKEHEGRNVGAFALQVDLATQNYASLRFTYMLASFARTDTEGFESSSDLTFVHTTLEYVLRIAGHTRHAPFDLSISAGLSVDVLHPGDGSDLDVDGRPRLSPYLAVDVAFWQSGSLGLLLHAGQAIPVNLTGGSSGSSDFSALFRVDLTHHMSLHAGYRIVVMRARDYEGSLTGNDNDYDYDGTLSGPTIGLEVRF